MEFSYAQVRSFFIKIIENFNFWEGGMGAF